MIIKNKNLSSGITITIIGSLALGIIGYAVRIVLSRNLSTEDYGLIYAALAFFSTFGLIFDLGIRNSGVILMGKAHNTKSFSTIYSTFFLTRTIIAVSFLVMLLPLSTILSSKYFQTPAESSSVKLFTIWLTFSIIAGGNLAALDVLHDYAKRALFQTGAMLITFMMLVSYSQITINNCAFAYAVGISAIALTLPLYLKHRHKLFPKISWGDYHRNLKGFLHFSKWVAISTASITLIFNMDSLMLVKLRGLEDVGFYNGALPIIQIPITILAFVPKVFIPHIATKINKVSTKKIVSSVYSFQLSVFIPCIIGLIIGYFVIDDIITLLFTEKFSPAKTAAFILCCGVPFYAMSLISIGFLQSLKKEKLTAIIMLIALFINFVLNFSLIPKYGINGAAFATLTTYITTFIMLQYTITKSR